VSSHEGCSPALARPAEPRLRLEVGDIFRAFGERFRREHVVSALGRKVMRAIEACRTAVLGGHLDVCEDCGFSRPSYNSCGNRHCPKCQALNQARWIAGRKARILPVKHFHVVFTLPAALRPLAIVNRAVVFAILFRVAAGTLLEFGWNERWIGGQLGITAVLHTWTRTLLFHPHLHCVVSDGGLTRDGKRWRKGKGKGKFLFPVRALSKVFRAKFVAALRRARRMGKLEFAGDCAGLEDDATFAGFCKDLFAKDRDWVVYAKRPFRDAEHIYEYLGRYTHRVAISNHRLIAMENDHVSFRTKDGRVETIHALEFIRRFLLHVLPSGFTKIRHYGLFASFNVNTRLEIARSLLDPTGTASIRAERTSSEDWLDTLASLTGIDLSRCPRCGGPMVIRVVARSVAALHVDPDPPD
jgi:hypothetical protein